MAVLKVEVYQSRTTSTYNMTKLQKPVTQTFGIDTVFSVSTWHNESKLFFRPSKTSRMCEPATC